MSVGPVVALLLFATSVLVALQPIRRPRALRWRATWSGRAPASCRSCSSSCCSPRPCRPSVRTGCWTEGDQPPSSPLDLDAAHAPPFFLAHGDRDTYVPVEGAREFAAGLRRSSEGPVIYAELPGRQHGFDRFRSPRFEAVMEGIATLLAQVRDRAGQGCRTPGRS